MADQPPQQQQGAESPYEEAGEEPCVPTLAPMPMSEEEVMGLPPVVMPGRWVIADARSGALETEPARSNQARTYTLLGVAERLLLLVTAEKERVRALEEEVVSVIQVRAVAAMRLWYLERVFHRRLRSHVDEFRREIRIMLDVFGHFDQRAIERQTGGPVLSIMQELSSSGSASTSAPASSASSVHAPGAGESGDGKTTYNVEVEAGTITLSRECARAATEEVAAAGGASAEEVAAAGGASAEEVAAAGGASAEEVAAAGGAGLSEEAIRKWSPGRIEKKKPEGASSSSSGKSTDSLTASASTLQEPSPSTSGAVVVDTLLASLQESEASAASDAMTMLQRVFTGMSEVLSRHVATAESILRQDQQRSLVVLGDDGEVEEQEQSPPTPQRQLVLDVGLMHSQMHSTQCCLSWSVARLQHILGELPPTPSAVRLPPAAGAGGHLARFSQIFKKPFSHNK